jgi:endonuclease YncB( thermonuclease family)
VHHRLSFASFAQPQRGGVLLLAGATFALGLFAGVTIAPVPAVRGSAPVATPAVPAPATEMPEPRPAYPAQVLRVIDGDTFEARVHLWPGLDITTKVRLRRIDAPEMHARCSDERVKAEAARAALETMLAQGGVGISRVTPDKYGGRVDADASTRTVADISAALLDAGLVHRYDGGRRANWC